tara:strand:- start:289 stop:417 length:129 start_codon:yes stop_codon:yes gene_type:complete
MRKKFNYKSFLPYDEKDAGAVSFWLNVLIFGGFGVFFILANL